jgi:hypothetical protein
MWIENSAFRIDCGGVRCLVSSHAIVSSVLNEMANEFLDRPTMIQHLTNMYATKTELNWIYLACFAVSIGSYAYYYSSLSSSYRKLNQLPEFRITYRNIQFAFLVFMVIFMKNIENAI